MNQLQAIQLLNTLSFSSFYDHAPVGTTLPFGVIHCDQPDNFAADNFVYCERWSFRFDLYTVDKDLELEQEIKTLLNNNGIYWTKSEEYLDEQLCWETEFDFEVMGNPDPITPPIDPDVPDDPTDPDDPEPIEGDDDGTEGNT